MHLAREEAFLQALQDFFMAPHALEMAAAYEALALLADAPAPYVEDWRAVEFAFNRLFIGPKALLAPPFASVYLEPEPQLMGRTTLQIRELYTLLDLQSPWKNVVPDDHISLELDAYRQLLAAEAATHAPELALARGYLAAHLRRWLPAFAARVQSAGVTPPAIWFVAAQLARWVVTTGDAPPTVAMHGTAGTSEPTFHRTGVFA
jgi:TorA maturation chaperone TorD